MSKHTPLYEKHVESGAKMVDFGGWQMPINYGSQIEEHHAVRADAGMFDVSHMTVIDLKGEGVRSYLRHLLANNVDKLTVPGKALYSCMLNESGGIIDDLIVYYLDENWFRLVVNAATREKDIAWMQKQLAGYAEVTLTERDELAMIAVQGPHAKEKVYAAMGEAIREAADGLKPFNAVTVGELFIATTGYTGEEGFEIILPAKAAPFTWQMLADAGVRPIGLGARDTLRLEAGMNLYGADMDESTNPLESGLSWTIGWDPAEREYIGRIDVDAMRNQAPRKLVGLVLEGKGILRGHQKILCGEAGEGEVTSGSFSPTLEQSIALARVPADAGDAVEVEIRGKTIPARVVKYPFVRNGKSCLE